MILASPTFHHEQPIPLKFTCDGPDVSPELHISDVPKDARSLALVMDDPDAPRGMFVHWVVWNIRPSTTTIGEGAVPGKQGRTDFGRVGYGGPCPPYGKHRYFFKLYALDTTLPLQEGSTKKDLETAMQGHIIARAELMGTYYRS